MSSEQNWIIPSLEDPETIPTHEGERVILAFGINDKQPTEEAHLAICYLKENGIVFSTEDNGRFFVQAWMRIPTLPQEFDKPQEAQK